MKETETDMEVVNKKECLKLGETMKNCKGRIMNITSSVRISISLLEYENLLEMRLEII